uniref:Uncharacterized protein n=1 Tax=Trichogramma kaykai TaxID=54128 RepID=A0ABD2WKW8_9HYME
MEMNRNDSDSDSASDSLEDSIVKKSSKCGIKEWNGYQRRELRRFGARRRRSSPAPDSRHQRERDQKWILEQSEVAEKNLHMRYVSHDVSQQGDHRLPHQLGAQSGGQQFLRHVLQALLQVLHVQVLQPRHVDRLITVINMSMLNNKSNFLLLKNEFFFSRFHAELTTVPTSEYQVSKHILSREPPFSSLASSLYM